MRSAHALRRSWRAYFRGANGTTTAVVGGVVVTCASPCRYMTRQLSSSSSSSTHADKPTRALPLLAMLRARRVNRRRYSADNTQGRSRGVRELVEHLRSLPEGEAKVFFDALAPRDRLDVLRALHTRRARRAHGTDADASSPAPRRLPLYRSAVFARHYCFREADVQEQYTLGQGPGGQATNRRKQTVALLHTPTGVRVKYSRFPSLWRNRTVARALLHLRVEQALLGDDSTLSRAAAQRTRRAAMRRAERQRIAAEGDALLARRARTRCVYAVQTGEACLPDAVLRELAACRGGDGAGGDARPTQLYLHSLFDEQCRDLWPMLTCAFAYANKTSPTTPCRRDGNDAEGVLVDTVPELLRYVFPAPDYGSVVAVPTSATAAETASTIAHVDDDKDNNNNDDEGEAASSEETRQLQRCRADVRVRDNVHRALRCVAELFGLRLTTRTAPSSSSSSRHTGDAATTASQTLMLTRDGANWRELRYRMIAQGQAAAATTNATANATATHVKEDGNRGSALTPLARMLWPWVYRSLRAMHMRDEAAAVRSFFAREARRGAATCLVALTCNVPTTCTAATAAAASTSTATRQPQQHHHDDGATAWAREALRALHAAATRSTRMCT